jgi:hypothetical protein
VPEVSPPRESAPAEPPAAVPDVSSPEESPAAVPSAAVPEAEIVADEPPAAAPEVSPPADAEIVTPPAAAAAPPIEAAAVEVPASIQVHEASVGAPRSPVPPAHAPSSVAGEIAVLALERRLVEERAEREALARELEEARRQIEGFSAHQHSAVERAREIVELEGKLAVQTARADAAVAHVTRLERELVDLQVAAETAQPIEVAPLPPRTRRPRRTEEWDRKTLLTAVLVVVVALIVVLTIAVTVL